MREDKLEPRVITAQVGVMLPPKRALPLSRASRAGLLPMTGPTNIPVASRQAGGGGQVPAQCRKGRQQARNCLGQQWPSPALGIAQLRLRAQVRASGELLGRGTWVEAPGEVVRKNKDQWCN